MEMEKKNEIEQENEEFLLDIACTGQTDLHQMLAVPSKKQAYNNMFHYLKSAVAELGEDRSFYTTNFADVLWKCQQWKEELPRVEMFYAVKANPDPTLLRFLVILGASFDCATEGEIRAVLVAGATPDRIIFANPNAPSGGLRYAKKMGVDLMTFDSEGALQRICNIHPTGRLVLRICPPEVECKFDFREKFGCKMEDVPELLKKAKEQGMDVVGVSFHVGCLNTRATAFESAIKDASKIFEMAQSMGFHFNILDIGGGFMGSIGTDHVFRKIARSLQESLSFYFPTEDVRVIAEPGCYVVSSAVTLTTTIAGKKTVRDTSEGKPSNVKQFYFLNNGVYSSFALGIEEYDIYFEPLLSDQDSLQRPCFSSMLFGQTLCPRDVMRRDIALPDLRVGESLVWYNMGAYSRSLCSVFCGFQLPDSRYVFKMDSRLKTDWIENLDEIAKFLLEYTNVVGEDDLPVKEAIINVSCALKRKKSKGCIYGK